MPTTTKSLTSRRPTRKSSAGVQPRMLTLVRKLRFLVDTTHALLAIRLRQTDAELRALEES